VLAVAGLADSGVLKSGSGAAFADSAIMWLLLAFSVHRLALFGIKFNASREDIAPVRLLSGLILKGLTLVVLSFLLALPLLFWPSGGVAIYTAAPDLSDIYVLLIGSP